MIETMFVIIVLVIMLIILISQYVMSFYRWAYLKPNYPEIVQIFVQELEVGNCRAKEHEDIERELSRK